MVDIIDDDDVIEALRNIRRKRKIGKAKDGEGLNINLNINVGEERRAVPPPNNFITPAPSA